MLWSVLSLETKMIAMFGCAIIIALSILIIICFLIPDTWWILPWTQAGSQDMVLNGLANGANDNNIQLRDFHQYHHPLDDSKTEKESSINNREQVHEQQDHKKSSNATFLLLSRNELCYDSYSGYSMDSGRPGSASICTGLGGGESTSSSQGSSIVTGERLSPSSSRSGSTTTLPTEETNRPQVHLTLQTNLISQSEEDDSDSVKNGIVDLQLIVTIENATDLPSRSYVDTVDPSVSVRLERSSRNRLGSLMDALLIGSSASGRRNSSHNHVLLTEDSTCPVVYHSRHPRFHHPVTFTVPKSTHLKDCQLVVRVEDKDKLVGTTVLGESRIDLREFDFLAGWLDGGISSHERSPSAAGESTVRLSRFIDIFKAEEKGAILLGLSFLPTSQRISINITQCNRLVKTSDSSAKSVVRLFLLNESGRVLKKRKTAPFDHPNGGGGRIELNELFQLDVEIERWDRCVILIVLSRLLLNSSNMNISPRQEDPQPIRSPPIYHHTGHVALGKKVLGHSERIHWNSAFQSPRRVISQWHCLH